MSLFINTLHQQATLPVHLFFSLNIYVPNISINITQKNLIRKNIIFKSILK